MMLRIISSDLMNHTEATSDTAKYRFSSFLRPTPWFFLQPLPLASKHDVPEPIERSQLDYRF